MRSILVAFLICCTPAVAAEKRMAVVGGDGVVQNVIVLDPSADWTPPAGTKVVEDKGAARLGGRYARGKFYAPTPPPLSGLPTGARVEDQTLADQVEALRAELEALKRR